MGDLSGKTTIVAGGLARKHCGPQGHVRSACHARYPPLNGRESFRSAPMNAHGKRGKMPLTYRDAGVDIDRGDALVERIAPLARATRRPGAEADLGGFGGLFDLRAAGFTDPVLVASTDGVGTKLRIAIETRCFGGLGQDLVAMCVNDIVVQGAQPLFFLDYYACGRLDVDDAAVIVQGIADACKASGCALIGGETAEMPGFYAMGDFDLAGFVVGAAERSDILPKREEMHPGDVLIGLASSGLHANGYSLVRKIIADAGFSYDAAAPFSPAETLGKALLTPTRLYVDGPLRAIRAGVVLGMAHITGGGITENLPRALRRGLAAEVDLDSWTPPPVFGWLSKVAGLETAELLRTFNCGIGLIAVAPQDKARDAVGLFAETGYAALPIGVLTEESGEAAVRYRGALAL